MAKNKIIFSIIIPVRTITPYVQETLKKLKSQTFKSFEIHVITDEISKKSKYTNHQIGPSYKRNLGAKIAKGQYLAFLDDDSYPSNNWLKNAYKIISKDSNIAAVCGPCLTPPNDNQRQVASGLVWSSYMGSGGAGVYRNSIQKKRYVDDYPTVNLIVNKDDFNKVGGFNNEYWPGEDTILCLNLTKKLNKKILYHPSLIVYHHRRNVLIPHLQQIKRYAIHRGYFAKKFPETSFRIGYFIPSLFALYLFIFLFINIYINITSTNRNIISFLLNLPFYSYLSILIFTFLSFLYKKNKFTTSFLATVAIPATHIYYGVLFIIGLASPRLKFKPHKVDQKQGIYIGG